MGVDPPDSCSMNASLLHQGENFVMTRGIELWQELQVPERLGPMPQRSERQFADDKRVASNAAIVQVCRE